MKILVLTGSPRKNGNSNTLAEHFINGAKEAGHEVTRFDAASSKVHPCIACNKCGMNGPCVFKDDFEVVRTHHSRRSGGVCNPHVLLRDFGSTENGH